MIYLWPPLCLTTHTMFNPVVGLVVQVICHLYFFLEIVKIKDIKPISKCFGLDTSILITMHPYLFSIS